MWSRDEEVSCRLHGLQGQVFLRDRHLGASQRCDFVTDHCWPRKRSSGPTRCRRNGHGCSGPSCGCRRGFPFQAVGRIAARRRQHGKTWARIGGADPGWHDMERGPGFGGLTSRSPQKPSSQRHLFHQETRRSRIASNRKFSRGDPWCERSGFCSDLSAQGLRDAPEIWVPPQIRPHSVARARRDSGIGRKEREG